MVYKLQKRMNARRLLLIVSLASVALSLWALPTAVKNRAFFEGITYKWPYNAAPADQTESNLAQIATDPDQIIAMLRTVYMDKTIPGNYVRGYDANNQNEGTWENGVATGNYPVAYPAIGTLGMSNNTFEFFRFNDTYGWNIPGTIKTSKGKGSVTFRANNQGDRARFNSIKKSGITVKATNMCYTYGSPSKYDAYYSVEKNDTLIITAAPGRKITKVTLSFRSDYNGGAASNFYSGWATRVYSVMSKQCYIKQIDVEYEAETVTEVSTSATFPDFYSGSETVRFTPGRNYGVGYDSSNSGNRANQGAFGIGYMSRMGTSSSTYYTANNSSTQWFFTQEGYIMTNFKLNFESAAYGTSNIKSISYLALDGSTYTTITATTTPSLSDFLTNATTLEFTLPTNYVSITPKSSTEMHITGVEATYVYNNFDDIYLAYDTYVPNEEGNTVLLLEVQDQVDLEALYTAGLAAYHEVTQNNKKVKVFDNYNITDYASLRTVVAATIKSARVLTSSKRVGANSTNPGTLFKIDCDKLNRFFLLGKGQLRWFDNDYNASDVNASTPPRSHTQNAEGQPYFFAGTSTSSNINQPYFYNRSAYFDQSLEALFGHMFEQFSPTVASGGESLNDIYRLLVNGDSFDVKHDCIDVISAEGKGHEFNMYGKTSASEDCQDVRDMMFLVPDYRMKAFTHPNVAKWSRDPYKAQRYIYYDSVHGHAPTIGLYTIKLNPITQVEKVEGKDAYDVTLNWNSNLLKFLPGETGKYTLYRVTNVNGVETYTALPEVTTAMTYVDRVEQKGGSQVVTYAVRGQDQDGFLTLQMSNKESAVIPGTDVSEQLQLQLGADYYSRFDPQPVQNNYSNLVKLGNSQVTNIQADYLATDGTEQFTFTRSYTDAQGPHEVTFATAHVASMSGNQGTLAVTLQNQDFFKYGYKSNSNNASATSPNGTTFTLPFTYDATGVNFGGVQIYDNFSVSVAANDHPGEYVYRVLFQYTDGGEQKYAYSNNMSVYVEKTDMAMNSYTLDEVEGDTDRGLPAGLIDFDIDVKYSSKKDILRYDAYRWNDGVSRYIIDPSSAVDNEQDVAPNGIAGNQGDHYSVAMNTGDDLYTGESAMLSENFVTTQAHFRDLWAGKNAGAYTYVPVVERFAPLETRGDYNTYGAPLRAAASAVIDLDDQLEDNPVVSDYTWQGDDNKTYAYYLVRLGLNALSTADKVRIPDGYELYKVRSWRLLDDTSVLGEEMSSRQSRISSDYLFEELTYPDVKAADAIVLGGSPTTFARPGKDEVAGTFGALDVNTYDNLTIPLKFVVRAYYTASDNLTAPSTGGNAPRRAQALVADGAKFFVVESVKEVTLQKGNVITAVRGVTMHRTVAGVTYYNMLGVPSTRPVAGVNIVVTRYSDGTVSTDKVVF